MMAFTADPEIPGRTVGEATTLEGDVANIAAIDAVPLILEVVCRITGMGFAAVARVTEDRWIACQVRDEIEFGLRPGGELKLETTICNEIRASGQPVAIDHVAEDADYCGHPTPAMYGFQSYISVPITLKDGTFFGTLCAIDPQPARVKTPETLGMFKLFAELIGSHLNARDRLQVSEAALIDQRHKPTALWTQARQVSERTRGVRKDVRSHRRRGTIGLPEQPKQECVALDHVRLEHGRCTQRQEANE